MEEYGVQLLWAFGYYASLVFLMRLAGKRLAGQTTTFDLIVLISMGVVLQTVALRPGPKNAAIFVVTVFVCHRALAVACARWPALRRAVRGGPRPLVKNGRVLQEALAREDLSYDELAAGLRRLGYASHDKVKLAVLEETGHISAIGMEEAPAP